MQRTVVVSNFQRACIFLIGAAGLGLLVLSLLFELRLFFGAGGLLVLFAALIPVAASRTYDYFSPWTALILGIVYGCTFPSLCMSFDLPSRQFVDQNILLGQRPEFFILPTLMIIATVLFVGVGFFALPCPRIRLRTERVSDPNRVFKVCLACAVVSAFSFLAFFQSNNGIEQGISAKRLGRSAHAQPETEVRQLGPPRQMAKLGIVGLYLLAASMGRTRRRSDQGRMTKRILLGCLLLVSVLFPFYASSRAGIVWIVMGLGGVLYYTNQKKLLSPGRCLTIITVLILVMFVTVSRNGGLKYQQAMMDRVGRLLLNRHGPDLAVTSHVVGNLPGKLEFQYGNTMLAWLIAPVPRELMENKPAVHCGPKIGQKIYQLNGSGVPPGITAELYWNFHWVGLVAGSLLLGLLMNATYQYCRRSAADLTLVAPIYMFAVFPIAFRVATHSFGYGILMNLFDFGLAYMVIFCASKGLSGHRLQSKPAVRDLCQSHTKWVGFYQ